MNCKTNTHEIAKAQRPIAVLTLSILTLAAPIPAILEYFAPDRLEVAFVYPSPDRPVLAVETFLALLTIFVAGKLVAFLFALMAGVGMLKNKRWSWFMAIVLHILIAFIFILAIALLAPYTSNSRIATLIISLASLYLLSRKDVIGYLRPAVKK